MERLKEGIDKDCATRTAENPTEKPQPPKDVAVSLKGAGRQLKASTRALRKYLPLCEREQHEELYDITVESARRFKACLLPHAEDVIQSTRRCFEDFQVLSLHDYRSSEHPEQLGRLRYKVDLAKSILDLAMNDSQKLLELASLGNVEIVENDPPLPQCRNGGHFPPLVEAAVREAKKWCDGISIFGATLAGVSIGSMTIPHLTGGVSLGVAPMVVAAVAAFGAAVFQANHAYQEHVQNWEHQIEWCSALDPALPPPAYPKASLFDTAKQLKAAMLDLDVYLGEVQALVSMESVAGGDGKPCKASEIHQRHAKCQAKARIIMEACKVFQYHVIEASTDLMSLESILGNKPPKHSWMAPLKPKIDHCALTNQLPGIIDGASLDFDSDKTSAWQGNQIKN